MWRPRLGIIAAAGAAVLGLAPAAASGATVKVDATTLTSESQTPQNGELSTLVPAYELVTVKADQLHLPWGDNASVVVSGWGTADVAGSRDRLGPGADLSLAYVEGAALHRALTFRIGRQFVTDGVARMTQLDGANARVVVLGGIGIEGYAGAIVTPRFAAPLADSMGGARLFWNPTIETEIGASYSQVFDHGLTVRQELGLDGRARVVRDIVLSGSAFYDPNEKRIAEATGDLSWRVFSQLAVGARYQRTAPSLFLPPNSIWAVFADDESRDSAGGFVVLNPFRHWSAWAEYLRIFGNDGNGYETSGRVAWTPAFFSIGLDVRALQYSEDGHVTPRLFVIARTGEKLTLSADLEETWLRQPMNGVTHVWAASGTAAWSLAGDWQIAAAVIGGETPFLSQDLELLGRLQWVPTFGGEKP